MGERTYRAELDLQGSVAAELCRWEVKSNQPVLTLVKREQGHWEKLVRVKVRPAVRTALIVPSVPDLDQ